MDKKRICLDRQLREACEDGTAAEVKCLLAKGAYADTASNGGVRPLHLAAYRGKDPEDKIKALLCNDANPDSQTNETKETPLHYAVRREAPYELVKKKGCAVIRILLDGGADPKIKDFAGRTPAKFAHELNCDQKVVAMLRIS